MSKSKASNQDLQKFIDEGIRISNGQVGNGFAQKFNGGSERKTAENIHKFLRKNTKYVKDGQMQVIKSARSLMKDKKGDCKSYSVFASSVLTKNGIPHSLVYTSYNDDPTPSHVYVQTDGGYVIDAVLPRFNKEAPYTYKHKKKVKAKLISGVSGYHSKVSGIGGTKKRKMLHAANVAGLFPIRMIFLGLIKLNIFGLATLINWKIASAWAAWKREKGQDTKEYPPYLQQLCNTWYNLGGNTANWYISKNKFAKAVGDGASIKGKKPLEPKRPLGLFLLKLLPYKLKSKLITNLKACGRSLATDPNWNASAVNKFYSSSALNAKAFPTPQEQQTAKKLYSSYTSTQDKKKINALTSKKGIAGIGAAGGGIGEAIVSSLPVLLPILYSVLGGNQPTEEEYEDLMDDSVRTGSYPKDIEAPDEKTKKPLKASLAALGGEFMTPLLLIAGTAFILKKTRAFK